MACCTEIQNDGNKVIKQGELKIAVGTGTTADTSSTNGNTKLKLAKREFKEGLYIEELLK